MNNLSCIIRQSWIIISWNTITFVATVYTVSSCFGDGLDVQSRVIEATKASRMGTQSAKAKVVFRAWGEKELLNRHGDIAMEHVGDRFRMDIRFQKIEQATGFFYDRVVLISDGDALFANSFSDLINPAGCEIKIRKKNISTFIIASGGIELDPSAPSEMMLGDLSSISNKLQLAGETAAGHPLLKYSLSESYEVLLEVSPEKGFNVVRREGRSTKDPTNLTIYAAEWDRRNGIWFIRKLSRSMHLKGKEKSRIELEFTSFDLDVSIPPQRFTMEALEPCEKVRVIDTRPDSDGDVQIFRYDPGINEKELDTIAAQVKALPARVPPPRDPLRANPETHSLLPWLIAFNVGLLIIVGLIFGYRRYKSHQAGH